MGSSWICVRCPGSPVFVIEAEGEPALLADVERHRVSRHHGAPDGGRWVEHDDWERVVGDWVACPLCKQPVTTSSITMTWECMNTDCTLSDGGPYDLGTLQISGPE